MKTIYILGIDPGITNTGIAIVALDDDGMRVVRHETFHTEPCDSLPGRLRAIAAKAFGFIRIPNKYCISKLAIEWKQKNAAVQYATGLWLGAFAACEWFTYTADEWHDVMLAGIPKTNAASKDQDTKTRALKRMLIDYPALADEPMLDHETDAICIATCAANTIKRERMVK